MSNIGNLIDQAKKAEFRMPNEGELILANGRSYSMDCFSTQRNNNVLIVGASGTGKTRSIVTPNILQATGSYVISDPKGNLYTKYAGYLRKKGYDVKKIDFIHPEKSETYNFFRYIHSERDIIKAAHMLVYGNNNDQPRGNDPFWDQATELYLSALISYLYEFRPESEQNLASIGKLIKATEINENSAAEKGPMDRIMEAVKRRNPDSFCVKQYDKFRVAAGKTLKSILISTSALLAAIDTPEVEIMMGGKAKEPEEKIEVDLTKFQYDIEFDYKAEEMDEMEPEEGSEDEPDDISKILNEIKNDYEKEKAKEMIEEQRILEESMFNFVNTDIDSIDLGGIGNKKTAVFVIVSDNDRSMDMLANLFFTQAMNELCLYADYKCENSRLPIPVRFILDDFATNVIIGDFPRIISSVRSRGISLMLCIQAEAQLEHAYGNDGRTIIGNCDNYVYMGGNDIETAYNVARRADVAEHRVLNMPVGVNWIFRRGEEPVMSRNFDIERFEDIKMNNRGCKLERLA